MLWFNCMESILFNWCVYESLDELYNWKRSVFLDWQTWQHCVSTSQVCFPTKRSFLGFSLCRQDSRSLHRQQSPESVCRASRLRPVNYTIWLTCLFGNIPATATEYVPMFDPMSERIKFGCCRKSHWGVQACKEPKKAASGKSIIAHSTRSSITPSHSPWCLQN